MVLRCSGHASRRVLNQEGPRSWPCATFQCRTASTDHAILAAGIRADIESTVDELVVPSASSARLHRQAFVMEASDLASDPRARQRHAIALGVILLFAAA